MPEKIGKSYQRMIAWNSYRLKQNNQSLQKLKILLSQLNRNEPADQTYEKDIVDLDALRMIYETSIRNFESQIEKYTDLVRNLSNKQG